MGIPPPREDSLDQASFKELLAETAWLDNPESREPTTEREQGQGDVIGTNVEAHPGEPGQKGKGKIDFPKVSIRQQVVQIVSIDTPT